MHLYQCICISHMTKTITFINHTMSKKIVQCIDEVIGDHNRSKDVNDCNNNSICVLYPFPGIELSQASPSVIQDFSSGAPVEVPEIDNISVHDFPTNDFVTYLNPDRTSFGDDVTSTTFTTSARYSSSFSDNDTEYDIDDDVMDIFDIIADFDDDMWYRILAMGSAVDVFDDDDHVTTIKNNDDDNGRNEPILAERRNLDSKIDNSSSCYSPRNTSRSNILLNTGRSESNACNRQIINSLTADHAKKEDEDEIVSKAPPKLDRTGKKPLKSVGLESKEMYSIYLMMKYIEVNETEDKNLLSVFEQIMDECYECHIAGYMEYQHLPGAIFQRVVDRIDDGSEFLRIYVSSKTYQHPKLDELRQTEASLEYGT